MISKEKLERAFRLQEEAAVRKKNVGEYFVRFSGRFLLPWLHRLADGYKERRTVPAHPLALLPLHYASREDREVAAFAALLLPTTDKMFEYIEEFRMMMGESPWRWFESRGFIVGSLGDDQNRRTGGIENWRIARLMDRMWSSCSFSARAPIGKDVDFVRPIGDVVCQRAKAQLCSRFDVLATMLQDCFVGEYFFKLRLLLMVLSCDDGFSLGLWDEDPQGVKCPISRDVSQFLRTWFPDRRRYGSEDEAIRLFGFERDCDFFYAYLAYEELQKRSPLECSRLATCYLRWYDGDIRKKPFVWQSLLPEVV